jgi:hypothetical protein
MHITIHRGGRRIHLCSRDADDSALVPMRFHDEWDAGRFLRRHFDAPCELAWVRAALALETDHLADFADDDVWVAAARLVACGRWRVRCDAEPIPQARPTRARARGAGASAPGPAPSRAPMRSPPPVPPPARPPTPAPSAPSPAQPELDQVAQARMLEQAARDGTPFCEICAARRQAA